jgi:tetratricopeptide (TPR) repeat protein
MLRSLALFCVVAVFVVSTAFAQNPQEKPEAIKPTPEVLALFEESFQSLAQVEPTQRIGGLFQLVRFAVNLEDKAPAKKIVDSLLALVPSLEQEAVRNQVYEALAYVHYDLGQYAEAVAVLQRITKPADRYQPQLGLAHSLVFGRELDPTMKPFDATELLRQGLAGAIEAKDSRVEGIARVLLGRELARQGKKAESVAAFAEALKVAQKLEQQGAGEIIASVLQSQITYDQIADAHVTLQAPTDPGLKAAIPNLFVQQLLESEKYDDAEKFIKTLPADETRDRFIHGFVDANLKTITDAKVGELAALISSDAHRERFLLVVAVHLQKNNRSDVAVQVSKRLKEPEEAKMALFIGKVDSMTEEKKFAEVIQFIDESQEDEAIRQHLKRQVLVMQYNETLEEAIVQKIMELHTPEEKITVAELRKTAQETLKNPNANERIDTLLEIFQEQCQVADLTGAKQTLALFAEQIGKETDPAQIIDYLLFLARLQIELRDKAGAKDTLGKLTQMLSSVKDVKELKGLLSDQQPEGAPAVSSDDRIRVELPVAGATPAPVVSESAIQDQLFRVYVTMAVQYAKVDAVAESKAAVEKAKSLARLEPVAAQKAEKLLILAQFLVE